MHFIQRPIRVSAIRCFALATLLIVPVLTLTRAARADSTGRQIANFASNTGNLLYLAAAVGLPVLRDGGHGTVDSLRAVDSIGASVVVAEGLKALTREERPDHSGHDSFPSAHATAAFAAATAEAAYHPREALFWYLGAAAIAQSRVRLNRHHEQDVLAGAALGYGMTRLELSAPHGLILAPLIDPAQHAAGLTLARAFH